MLVAILFLQLTMKNTLYVPIRRVLRFNTSVQEKVDNLVHRLGKADNDESNSKWTLVI